MGNTAQCGGEEHDTSNAWLCRSRLQSHRLVGKMMTQTQAWDARHVDAARYSLELHLLIVCVQSGQCRMVGCQKLLACLQVATMVHSAK